MKRLLLLVALWGGCLTLHAQAPCTAAEADARVGALINASDYDTLASELPALRDSVSQPLQALSDVLVGYRSGRPAESNAAYERLVAYEDVFGKELLMNMLGLVIYNCWTLGDFAGAEHALRTLSESAPEPSPQSRSTLRWFSALRDLPATSVRRPDGEIVLPTALVSVGRGDHLLVDAEVNGHTEPFIFDTGCSHANFISAAAARRMGIRIIADSICVTGMTSGLVRLGIADSMRIGDLTVLHPTFLVADRMSDKPVENLSEAVLGTDIIRALGEVRIEARRNRIVLPATESAAPEVPNLRISGTQYHLVCRIDADPACVQFDTGNVKSDLSEHWRATHRHSIRKVGKKGRSERGGFGGMRKIKVYTLPDVAVEGTGCPVVLHRVEVSAGSKGFDADHDGIDGSIGTDFLTGCNAVTIDLQRMFIRTE